MRFWISSILAAALVVSLAVGLAPAATADGNRLAYLDEPCDPYYVGLHTPRLITPQWIGEPGVEAVIVLSIDDLRDTAHHERYLRPILERLKKIDGRAPVSVMTNRIDPADPQLQAWIAEGLSIETHTFDHPCPCMTAAGLAATKETYDRCIDLLHQIPNQVPVAFRLPCCDSMNSGGPRFFLEVFNKTTPAGNFLAVESSVFTLPTEADPAMPRELLIDEEGKLRFDKYIPRDRGFVNYVENYPYPYVLGRLGWQVPPAIPSDWEAQNHNGLAHPSTLRDLKAGLDAVVLKQGVFTLCFHANQWMGNELATAFVDYAATRYGPRVKFLNFRELHERLTENLLAGQPLRAANGQDNGVRLLDLDGDGIMDAVIGNEHLRQTRIWKADQGRWEVTDFPVEIVLVDGENRRGDAGVRFGVLRDDGRASFLVRNEKAAGLWHFDGRRWVADPRGLEGLDLDGPVVSARGGRDRGARLRDVDGSGVCELVVGNPDEQAVFGWRPDRGWTRLPYGLPAATTIVDSRGRDAGFRFVDLNADGLADIVFSNPQRYSVDLFQPSGGGWSRRVLEGRREETQPENPQDSQAIPPLVRADGTNNGAWFRQGHLFVQNEETAKLVGQVISRRFADLLGAEGLGD